MKNMQQKRSSWLMGTAVVLVSGLLMTACQPAAQPAAAAQTQAQGQTQTQGFGNGQRPNFQMTAAPELPTDQPALRGALVSLNGTMLTVQEGGLGLRGGNFGGVITAHHARHKTARRARGRRRGRRFKSTPAGRRCMKTRRLPISTASRPAARFNRRWSPVP